MGFFSWHTNDTDEIIWNRYSGKRTMKVYMIDNKGNEWLEKKYEGYGEFGGKDYYELLAEMNGLPSDRLEGIRLNFNEEGKEYITPNLVTESGMTWENEEPRNHSGQGHWDL